MIKLIQTIYNLLNKNPSISIGHPDPDYKDELANIPRWPPFDNGLPFVHTDSILQTQSKLIDDIKRIIPSDLVDKSILNFVRYVHLLPATKDENHRGAGGLFRMGLEIAYYSLRTSEGKIFTAAETPDERQRREPKWRLAAFIAGLCCETYRAMSGVVVTSGDGNKWPSLNMPLTTWLEQNNIERYYLRWIKASLSSHQQQTMSSYVASQIIPLEVTQEIQTDFNEIALALMATINGSGLDHPNPLTTLVQDVRTRVIERDLATDNVNFGKPIVGTHLEPHILTSMRKLVSSNVWTINEKGSRIWADKNSIYIIWKPAFAELHAHLDSQAIKGIPNDMHVVADIMIKSEAFVPDSAKASNYYLIYPPTSNESYPAVKLSSIDILLDYDAQKSLKLLQQDLLKPPPKQPKDLPQKTTQKDNKKSPNKPLFDEENINQIQQVTDENTPLNIEQNVEQNVLQNVEQNVDVESFYSQQLEPHLIEQTHHESYPPQDYDLLSIAVESEHHHEQLDASIDYQSQINDIPSHHPDDDQNDENTDTETQDILLPVQKTKPTLTPKQKMEIQKLDSKLQPLLESVILSHQDKSKNNGKSIGFPHLFKLTNNQTKKLYAIPLSISEEMSIDRVFLTHQLHSKGFAWIEPGQTRKVSTLNNPNTSKSEMCILLKTEVSQSLGLID